MKTYKTPNYWNKFCNKCKKTYRVKDLQELLKHFWASKNESDCLDKTCKKCRNKYWGKNKDKLKKKKKRTDKTNIRRILNRKAQVATRNKYGKASKYYCCTCGIPANEWHHILYRRDGAVPVCKGCHGIFHEKNNINFFKKFLDADD